MPAIEATLTILVDNQAAPPLAAEHGFALWIDAAGRRILFDAGQGGALPGNAEQLGIDLSAADTLVLSHGHYDHGGGIPAVLARHPAIAVVAHSGCLRSRYVVSKQETRAVGLPEAAAAALRRHSQVHWADTPVALAPAIGVTGAIRRGNDFEEIDHARHARGSNFVFGDASVRLLTKNQALYPENLWAVTDEFRHPPGPPK